MFTNLQSLEFTSIMNLDNEQQICDFVTIEITDTLKSQYSCCRDLMETPKSLWWLGPQFYHVTYCAKQHIYCPITDLFFICRI